ncbi:MAG: hypothetical protein FD145_419 [Candidatus Saganbacteria bacterium]|uniref:Uncharacterized protein n=1 Tax=Candidatus Saganbacteria bacterium TaxID=2575572 RepID=A0A833L1Y9_UNCSA|nr:MAG: hypothetical protein FD145_419 [Candidatus Saganbacteria bacterium]
MICRLVVIFLILFYGGAGATLRDLPFKETYDTPEFSIKFSPTYPLVIGKETNIYIKTPLNAVGIIVQFKDTLKVNLVKSGDTWSGKVNIFDKYKDGWQPLTIYIKHKKNIGFMTIFDNIFNFFRQKSEPKYKYEVIGKRFWIRAFTPLKKGGKAKLEIKQFAPKEFDRISKGLDATQESMAIEISPTAEAISIEASPIAIKGSRIFSFQSRNIEGSKEGYLAGIAREESLRLNISGKVSDTDINANFFSTSSIGTTQVASREEKISILLKRASTEAYFGDFTADLADTEFSRLNKVLSGVKLSGDYEKFSFKAIASTPQGQSKAVKMYGNGTQGPYTLGYKTVVNSERVYVDGALQKRGEDYEIDYIAGTVTFKNKIIIKTQIIEIYFDWRETTYKHSTYALRANGNLNPNLKLGASWIDDSDLKNGADAIYTSTSSAEAPKSHYILGTDGELNLGSLLSAKGEFAYSEKNLNILDPQNPKSIGKAGKIETSSMLGPFYLGTRYKKIGAKFELISDALPKQNLLEYGGLFTFRPNDVVNASANYNNEKFSQAGVDFNTLTRNAKIMLSPQKLPSLGFSLDELEENNDPVPPYTQINRLTTRNYYDLNHTIGRLNFSSKYTHEKRLNRYPTEEATIYKIAGFGLSTTGIEKFSLAANLELKDSDLPGGIKPFTKTYSLNLSASPRKEYMASIALDYIDDSIDGKTNVTDIAYKADPTEKISTDGKYNVTSVNELFGSTNEVVTKTVGSFRLDLRPVQALRLKYYFKPNFTILNRTQGKTYNDETQQYEINLLPSNSLMLGGVYKTNNNLSIDKTDYPNYKRISSDQNSKSYIYTLKSAPLRFISLELNYLMDDAIANNLQSPATSETFQRTNGQNREFSANIRTSLSERFAVDSSYSNKFTKSGTAEMLDNSTNSQTMTGSLKGTLNLNDFWAFSLSYSFSQSKDFLSIQESYSITPGAGFIFRFYEGLRIDGDYTYSKFYQSLSTEKTNISLRAKYDLSEYVHISLRHEQEISKQPDYRTSDFTGYVEINL